jgi:hypothetical protein
MENNRAVETLLIEREGYVRRGLTARIAQVDAALRALGIEVEETATASPVVERAVKKRAKKRGE